MSDRAVHAVRHARQSAARRPSRAALRLLAGGTVFALAAAGLAEVARADLPATSAPVLTLGTTIPTAPFTGSAVSAKDVDGAAYVPKDGALWVVDGKARAVYEVDATTKALRRTVATSAFLAATDVAGTGAADTTRVDGFTAAAYDPAGDALYVFSGNVGGSTTAVPPVENNPTVFKLTRDGTGAFRPVSWRDLPDLSTSDVDGAAVRPGSSLLWTARGTKVRTVDFATGTVTTVATVSGITSMRGLSFSDDGANAYVVGDGAVFLRTSTAGSTWAALPGWTLSLSGLGVLDARSVDVVGSRLVVADGADTRVAGDPLRWALFGIDVAAAAAAPVASFTASATSGTAPLAVAFNDTSTNAPTSWAWTFGDGGTSTLAAPSHTFTAAGTYTVTLTATNASGGSSASRTVTVTAGAAAPVARFRGTATGATVSFTDESAGSPTARTWDFGDGTTSSAANPSRTYAADGVYSVSLTVTNAGGSNTRVRSSYVTVTGGVATVLARDALPDVEGPGLRLSRTVAAAPFRGSTTSMRDDEGSAYVPRDGSLWLTDDAAARLYEVDAVTGALKRTVPTADLANALPVGGGAAAGASRTDDLGSAAYDPVADALYVFSGNCCAATGLDPTVFRLSRDGAGAFQVASWRALPDGTDPTGAAYRAGVGITLVRGQKVTPYDYATGTLGSAQSIAGTDVAITGAAFTPDGAELLAVSSGKRFYRASMATNAVRQGWTIDLTPFGILDPRAVELVDGQLYVSDGADTRDVADPLRYAVFVFDVVDATAPPTAAFTFTPPTGAAPHEVQFTDASTGAPKSWLWEFGDGTTSRLQSPSHAFSKPGTYSVKLTVGNARGTNSTTVTNAVTATPNSPLLAARFTASVTAGAAPLAVQFTDDSTGPVVSRAWDFGDGTTSTATSPLKTYPVNGTYTVRLTVTTADGRTNTRVRTDYVRVGGGTVTFGTAADTWVRSDTVTATNGTAATMRGKSGGTATYQPYLRFSVNGLTQTPTRATLRLFTTDASAGTGTLYRTTDATWSESALSWSTRPAVTGTPVAASKAAPLGAWVELDVTSVVTGDGEYSFTLADPPTDAVAFSSKESTTASQRPQLVVAFGGPPPAPSLVLPATPALRLNRLFTTSPFSGTTVTARDQEGSAYVPKDDALWISDDNSGRVYEVDARTSLLRRVITQEDLVNALPIGGGTEPAGPARADDLEAMAYDADADVLYLLAGNCCGTAPFKPTAYQFTRDAAGQLQLAGYKPLPEGTDNTGLGWRKGQGLVGVHSDHVIPYDFATNTVGPELTLAPFNNQQFVGLDFTDDGRYAFVTTKGQRLYLFDAATWTLVPGWDLDLAPFGLLDPRSVEIVDGQLWIGDGYDFRDPTDPMEYATFVFDLVGPSKASFTAAPTAGTAPLPVTFTDTTLGDVTSRTWTFGDGTTSTLPVVTKTYTTPGTYTVSLTVTGPAGSSTETRTGLVVVGAAPSEVLAAGDATARSDAPTTSYGGGSSIAGRVLTAGQYQPYLRFTVPALGRPVAKATLRLYVTDASDATGPVFRTVDGAWSEPALTWNTRPAVTGTQVAASQKVVVGQWVEFDVTSVVTGAGDYGFVLPATSTNAVGFASKEAGAATAPRIALTLG